MKCKICGAESVVKDDSKYVCKSCGSVFYEEPTDNVEVIAAIAEAPEKEEVAPVIQEEAAAAEADTADVEEAFVESEEEPETVDAAEEIKAVPVIEDISKPFYEPERMADFSVNETEILEPPVKAEAEESEDSEEADGDTDEPDKKKKSTFREILDFCLPIIIALIIAMVLKTCVFANAQVPTGSMLNTIQEGDRVIASRLEYKFNDPKRYDIIIFQFPDDVEAHKKDKSVKVEYFVKRIIGLPGETVEIVNGTVYVTDKDGNSTQLKDDFITACTPTGNYGPYEVPENSYFVLGDNRESSIDSRFWKTTNFVDRDLIIGKVKFRYYPSIGNLDTETEKE